MMKKFRNYAIAIGVAVVFVILYLLYTDAFHAETTVLRMKHLSDAFLVPGCVYLGICVIHIVSLWGTMDMISYSFKQFSRLFSRKREENETHSRKDEYFNYVQSRRGRKFTLWHLLFPGIAFFLLAIVFSVAYFTV